MKKAVCALFLAAAVMTAVAGGAGWLTNPAIAHAQAKREGKLVMMDFTGSDWCGWCIKLDKEVFSKPEFLAYAKTNLVLMEVDFPQRKKLSGEQKKINDALARKYKIEGYPTIVLVDGDGNRVGGDLGYVEGGPKAFIAQIEAAKSAAKKK